MRIYYMDSSMPINTREELVSILIETKPELIKNFGLKSLGIFGSFSNNHVTPESDVDLLVDFIEPKYDYLVGMQNHLEKKLGRHVDIVRKRSNIRKSFIERINKELINV